MKPETVNYTDTFPGVINRRPYGTNFYTPVITGKDNEILLEFDRGFPDEDGAMKFARGKVKELERLGYVLITAN